MHPLQTLTASSRRVTYLVMLACTASLLGCNAREGATRSFAPPGGAAGSGWTADPSPMVLESVKVPDAPALDGQVEEAWSKARPLTVDVREAMGGDHPKPVVLRAIHTDDSFFILARWPDATPSDMRDPFIWNEVNQAYDRPSKPDDQFALQFPMTDDFAISMLTVTRSFTSDVWHWKAGRGNPVGWVDDKRHVISQTPIDHPAAVTHDIHGGRTVHILRAQDGGTSPYRAEDKPTQYEGDVVDSFVQQEPDGSMADVRGKGVHDGEGWTLEMGRVFNTGHPEDDAIVDPRSDNRCAVAVLDDELYEEHSVSSLILLRFTDPDGGEAGFDFEDASTGDPPAGFTTALTGSGTAGEWVIREDANPFGRTMVLAQADADRTSGRYPLCILDGLAAKDVDLSVDFKPVSGRGDQAAGLVWRLKDKDNFLVVRANALENNVVAYKTVNGKRSSIGITGDPRAYGVEAQVVTGQWQTLRVRAVGNTAEVYLNGQKLFEVENETFAESGKVGLWTKADSVIHFDNFRVRPLDPTSPATALE